MSRFTVLRSKGGFALSPVDPCEIGKFSTIEQAKNAGEQDAALNGYLLTNWVHHPTWEVQYFAAIMLPDNIGEHIGTYDILDSERIG